MIFLLKKAAKNEIWIAPFCTASLAGKEKAYSWWDERNVSIGSERLAPAATLCPALSPGPKHRSPHFLPAIKLSHCSPQANQRVIQAATCSTCTRPIPIIPARPPPTKKKERKEEQNKTKNPNLDFVALEPLLVKFFLSSFLTVPFLFLFIPRLALFSIDSCRPPSIAIATEINRPRSH